MSELFIVRWLFPQERTEAWLKQPNNGLVGRRHRNCSTDQRNRDASTPSGTGTLEPHTQAEWAVAESIPTGQQGRDDDPEDNR
ncbi:MAG: hypothetical protein ACP5I4_03575 [Oceanipulchritudo sp.]